MANTKLDLSVIGTTGLRQFGGQVYEEFLRDLQGRNAARAFREMRDNSSTIGAIAFAIENLIRQVQWRVEPASDKPPAKAEAEFLEGAMDDMSTSWDETLSEALTHLTYGWAFLEIIYKVRRGLDTTNPMYRSKFDDGRIGWRKMPLRSQETLDRWEIDPEDSGIRGMWQSDPYSTGRSSFSVFIPIEKALLFRMDSQKGNPESRSLYRNAYVDYFRLKRILVIEAIGIERDMTGLIVLETPEEILSPSATPEHKALRAELETMCSRLKRDEQEYAIIPSEQSSEGKPTGWRLRLLNSGGRRQIDTDAIVKRYQTNMTMSVLADFLMLGAGNTGSWALSSDKTRLFAMAVGAILDNMAAVFNRYAIPRLMQLNGVPSDLWPELKHGDLETPALDEMGTFIANLGGAGFISPDKPLERALRGMAKLPEPDEDAPLPGEALPALPAGPQAAKPEASVPEAPAATKRPPPEDDDDEEESAGT